MSLSPALRSRGSLCLAAAWPAVLVVFFAFRGGGYFPGTVALAATELCLLLALVMALRARPFASWSPGVAIAAAAIAAFAGWILITAHWSGAPSRAYREFDRAVLYGTVLLLAAALPRSVLRLRVMAYFVATAIFVVCAVAVANRILPDVVTYVNTVHPERLAYPFEYWNTLGIFAAVGAILCGHFTCDAREPRIVRVLAAGALPLLATAVYYTLSRGAMWAGLVGVVVYLVVGRPRAWLGGAIAAVPTTVGIIAVANPPDALTAFPLTPEAIAKGHHVALMLAVATVAALALRTVALPLDTKLDQIRLSPAGRRVLVLVSALLAMGTLSSAAVALNARHFVSDKYKEFSAENRVQQGGSGRLLSLNNNGRIDHWRVGLHVYSANKVHGAGAGTYEQAWTQYRRTGFTVRDGHSLYIETMDEMGIVGLILIVGLVLTLLGGFARLARGPDRALGGALFAAGVAWALHAGIDWDWEMPAATLWIFALGGVALARSRPPSGDALPVVSKARTQLTWVARGGAALACVALAIVPAKVAVAESRLKTALADAHAGDCGRAVPLARRSLETDKTPTAYQLLAWCLINTDSKAALAASKSAVRADPRNWELHYGLGIARAANGLNPRGQMRIAIRLNPLDELPKAGLQHFSAKRHGSAKRWRAQARRGVALTLPSA